MNLALAPIPVSGANVTAQPAVSDGLVYVGASDGTFYALPEDSIGTPTPAWTFHLRDVNETSYGKFVSSPAVVHLGGARPAVIVGGGSSLLVLDGFTGDRTCGARAPARSWRSNRRRPSFR